LDAAVDAAALPGRDGLGGEVVDAGHEAVLNETTESLGWRTCQLILDIKC
jgi:hypothetical protein